MQKSKFPEPYSWMVSDLTKSIRLARANYLVALGLFCYSEIIGRHIMRYKKASKRDIKDNNKCFNLFVGEYMGYKMLIGKYREKICDWFRNGLCHEYYIKGQQTGVYVSYDRKTSKQGIVISKNENKKFLVIKSYLRDFKMGIAKFLKESKKILNHGQQKNRKINL